MFLITQIKNKLSLQKCAEKINIVVNHLLLENVSNRTIRNANFISPEIVKVFTHNCARIVKAISLFLAIMLQLWCNYGEQEGHKYRQENLHAI